VNRAQKQYDCYNHIYSLIGQKKISATSYPYLMQLAKYFEDNKVTDSNVALQIFQQYVSH
jgi:hypothetical protein